MLRFVHMLALLQTRFSMELAALGTPDMPLNKARVPRQAATAAKAAIKQNLLQQNMRPGAASVPPKSIDPHEAEVSVSKAKLSNLKSNKRQHSKVQLLCLVQSMLRHVSGQAVC